MTKIKLIQLLQSISTSDWDIEPWFDKADQMLLDFIDDETVTKIYATMKNKLKKQKDDPNFYISRKETEI